MMRSESSARKLVVAAILVAVAVVGSMFSFPVLASRCSPVQHMVNILCAVFLGPWYGFAAAFLAGDVQTSVMAHYAPGLFSTKQKLHSRHPAPDEDTAAVLELVEWREDAPYG